MSATTFAGLFDDLKAEAQKLWAGAVSEAKAFEAAFVPKAEAEIAAAASQFKTFAVNMAWSLASQEFANLTGGQKNTITIASIKSMAANQGIQLAVGTAEKLAEDAYQALKTTAPSVLPTS